jgi:protein phosphatase
LITPDKVRNHSQRSILTKSVGIGLFVQPDLSQHKLQKEDYLILCSDGVWSVIQDEEIAQVVNQNVEIDRVSQNLVKMALDRKTEDNVSVVAIHVQELIPAPSEKRQPFRSKWFRYRRKLV